MTALDPTAMLCEPSGMPSTIWTGSISFGLVAVPVRVISATKSLDVRFNQLEEGTNARIRYRKISEANGDEVTNARIQQGNEHTPAPSPISDAYKTKTIPPTSTH